MMNLFLKRASILVILAASILCVQAQNLADYIPAETNLVISLHGGRIASKANLEAIYDLPVVTKMYSEFQKELKFPVDDIHKNPEGIGLKSKSDSYFTMAYQDTVIFMTILMEVSDKEKLKGFVHQLVDERGIVIEKKADLEYMTEGKSILAWNEDMVALSWYFSTGSGSSIYAEVRYSDPDYDQKIEELKAQQEQRMASAILEYGTHLRKEAGLSSKSKNFTKYLSQDHDFGIWLDDAMVSSWMKLSIREAVGAAMFKKLKDQLSGIMLGSYYQFHGKINQGQIDVYAQVYQNEKLMALTQGAYDNRINPDFLKYISQENLVGFYSSSFDMEKVLTAFWEVYKPILSSMPEYGEKISTAIDLVEIFLDEKAIINLVDGDMLFAFTGLMEYEFSYIDFEYDENFEQHERQTTRKETIPEFSVQIGTGKDFDKIVRFLKAYELIHAVEGEVYYQIVNGAMSFPLYLIYQDQRVLLTNSYDLISHLEKGYKKKKRIKGDLENLILENSLAGYFDFVKLLDMVERTITKSASPRQNESIALVKNVFKDVTLKGVNVKDNMYESEYHIAFQDDKSNALEIVFNFINEFFLLEKRPKY